MRVRLGSTTSCKDLVPKQSYETFYLWTEGGALDTVAKMFHSYRTTEDSNILDIESRPFHGSLSKVYHAEPILITRYSDTLWQEGDIVYEMLRPNSAPQTPLPNKCGSLKS